MLAETIQSLGDRVKAYHTDGFIVQGTIKSDQLTIVLETQNDPIEAQGQ
jgi:sRNA-binding regulator protein Hfq